MVNNGLVTYRTLWHIGNVTQRADPESSMSPPTPHPHPPHIAVRYREYSN